MRQGNLQDEKTVTFPHIGGASAHDGFETIIPTPYGNQILLELAKPPSMLNNWAKSAADLLCVSFSSVDYVRHRFRPILSGGSGSGAATRPPA